MSRGQTADRLQLWIDARKRHRLSHEQLQMARELGLNPKKLGQNLTFYCNLNLQNAHAKVHFFATTFATVSSGFINIDYARVSTLNLNLDVQMRALRKTGCKKSFGSNKLRMPCPGGPVYLS
jgi:hypothetical protein